MGLMKNPECHAAQHQLFQSGITVRPNDDQIHAFLLSVLSDCIGRSVTLQGLRFYLNPLGAKPGLYICKIFP